jgi:hypothetical protein
VRVGSASREGDRVRAKLECQGARGRRGRWAGERATGGRTESRQNDVPIFFSTSYFLGVEIICGGVLGQARPWACATGAAVQGLQMQRASNLNSNNSASA